MIYIISMGPPSTGGRRRERIIHAMRVGFAAGARGKRLKLFASR
jgi:hypothetical protein